MPTWPIVVLGPDSNGYMHKVSSGQFITADNADDAKRAAKELSSKLGGTARAISFTTDGRIHVYLAGRKQLRARRAPRPQLDELPSEGTVGVVKEHPIKVTDVWKRPPGPRDN